VLLVLQHLALRPWACHATLWAHHHVLHVLLGQHGLLGHQVGRWGLLRLAQHRQPLLLPVQHLRLLVVPQHCAGRRTHAPLHLVLLVAVGLGAGLEGA
jgi:hypothetical protein